MVFWRGEETSEVRYVGCGGDRIGGGGLSKVGRKDGAGGEQEGGGRPRGCLLCRGSTAHARKSPRVVRSPLPCVRAPAPRGFVSSGRGGPRPPQAAARALFLCARAAAACLLGGSEIGATAGAPSRTARHYPRGKNGRRAAKKEGEERGRGWGRGALKSKSLAAALPTEGARARAVWWCASNERMMKRVMTAGRGRGVNDMLLLPTGTSGRGRG